MRDKLEHLREQVRSQEPSTEQRAAWREQVVQHGEAFLERLPRQPVYRIERET